MKQREGFSATTFQTPQKSDANIYLQNRRENRQVLCETVTKMGRTHDWVTTTNSRNLHVGQLGKVPTEKPVTADRRTKNTETVGMNIPDHKA